MTERSRLLVLPIVAVLGLLLGGCGGYSLKGRVVSGDVSYVAVVDKDDPRLDWPAVEGAQVDLIVEPSDLNRERMNPQFSGADGAVRVPVKKVGAGLIKFEVSVSARRSGFRSSHGVFDLPKKSRRLLVVMAPGDDPPGNNGQPRTIEDDLRDFGGERTIEDDIREFGGGGGR